MMKTNLLLLTLLTMAGSALANANNRTVKITALHQSANELKIKADLEHLQQKYDLSRWTYTNNVQVDEKAEVPRSHPVLTMNTHENYLKSQTKLLSTYLHEQFHWHVIINGKASYRQFMQRVKAEFPDVKSGGSLGSSDEEGTLNHIVVCYLEYLALSELIGQTEAKKNLASNHYYKWVYQTVLEPKNKGKLDKLLNEFGLTWSAAAK